MNTSRKKPVIFVSSTCYDLKQIRTDMKEFLEGNYGFEAMLSEFDSFPVDPCVGTFENCLSNVDQCADIFVLIVGNRYGHVLESGKSITNLEYLHAKAKSIPMYVFVNKQIHNTLPIWRTNQSGDFSSVVDNSKIFEFVASIYDECKQWIYTYDNARDIKMTLKNQFGLIFSDGLKYKTITTDSRNSVLRCDLPSGAARMVIEKPYAWEYKFFAYVLKDEFDKLQQRKWDLRYGIFDGKTYDRNTQDLLDDISERLNEIGKLIDILSVLINKTIQEAIGEPGIESDLDMMIYTAKRLAATYERLIGWSLYFKSLHVDEVFDRLIDLLYNLPKSALSTIDTFIEEFYSQITIIPDVEDNVDRNLKIHAKLDISNLDEINAEITRLAALIRN